MSNKKAMLSQGNRAMPRFIHHITIQRGISGWSPWEYWCLFIPPGSA